MHFQEKIKHAIQENNSLLCIGLDPDPDKIPPIFLQTNDPFFSFNKSIIDQTHDLVCAYKPNSAFYEAQGVEGIESLKKTINYLTTMYPTIPVILDAKRGDIGNTAEKYAKAAFDYLQADAITLNPYLGFDSIKPYSDYKEKGIFILCRTSNEGAKDFQDMEENGEPLYIRVAKKTAEWNQSHHNCNLVIGATWPEQLKRIRVINPSMFFLVPGTGAQGGDVASTLENGLTEERSGLIISSSRAILYAQFPREQAQNARNEINTYR